MEYCLKQGGVTTDRVSSPVSLLRWSLAGSGKGSDIDPFADLDKGEDQVEETWAPWLQSMCDKASVYALV